MAEADFELVSRNGDDLELIAGPSTFGPSSGEETGPLPAYTPPQFKEPELSAGRDQTSSILSRLRRAAMGPSELEQLQESVPYEGGYAYKPLNQEREGVVPTLVGGGSEEVIQRLSPDYAQPGAGNVERVLRGTGRGLVRGAAGLFSPLSLLGGAGATVGGGGRVLSGAFAADMARATIQGAKATADAIREGDWETAAEMLTSTGLSGLFATGAATHAIKGGPTQLQRLQEKVRNELAPEELRAARESYEAYQLRQIPESALELQPKEPNAITTGQTSLQDERQRIADIVESQRQDRPQPAPELQTRPETGTGDLLPVDQTEVIGNRHAEDSEQRELAGGTRLSNKQRAEATGQTIQEVAQENATRATTDKTNFRAGLKEGDVLEVSGDEIVQNPDGSTTRQAAKPLRYRVVDEGGRWVAEPIDDTNGPAFGLEPDSGQHFFSVLNAPTHGGVVLRRNLKIQRGQIASPVPNNEGVTAGRGGTTVPIVPEGAQVATETGWTFNSTPQSAGVNLQGVPPELVGQMPRTYEFTDRRSGSPTEGFTVYVPEGATAEQMRAAIKAKEMVVTTPTQTALEPNLYPVVELPIEKLNLSRDVPNFKEGASLSTGVVEGQELKGKYNRLTGPITVWERLGGKLEIISGRHRFDLAKRAGEKTIPAQVLKESDGFTKQHAMVLDAELNILDEKGSVKDYANYFRNYQSLTRPEAEARGLLSRAKGVAGWVLGRDAEPDLFALYANGRISEAQSVAIAQAAPNDANFQRIGIRAAKEDVSPESIKARIEAARASQGTEKASQSDFFADTTLDRTWAKQAEYVARKRQALKDIISTRGAVLKKYEAATSTGSINADQAKAQDELNAATVEQQRWQEWWKDPELKAEVERGANTPSKGAETSPGLAGAVIQKGTAERYQVESILGNIHDHNVSANITGKRGFVARVSEELSALTPQELVEVARIRETIANGFRDDPAGRSALGEQLIYRLRKKALFKLGQQVNQELPRGQGLTPNADALKIAADKIGISKAVAKTAFDEFTYGNALAEPVKITPESAKPVAEESATPKLRQMENQGDLLSGQTEDLTLVGEKGTDQERIAQQKAAAEKAKAEAAALTAKQQQTLPGTQPKIFTNDAAQAARERLKKKLGGQQTIFVDPTVLGDVVVIAGNIIERGAIKFNDFVREMTHELGDGFKDYFKPAYNQVREYTEAHSLKNQLTPREDVERYDYQTGTFSAAGVGREPEPAGTVRGSSNLGRPGIRVVDEGDLPAARPIVRAGQYTGANGHAIDETQRVAINSALTAFEDGKEAYLLGDGTGVGKTGSLLVVAHETMRRTGKPSLIVTQNKGIISNRFMEDADKFGIPLDGIQFMTFDDLSRGKVPPADYGVVLFDEAHNLKNAGSAREFNSQKIKADHKVFATATPMDSPSHAAYFLSQLTGKTQEEIASALGYSMQERTVGGEVRTFAVLKPNTSWADVVDNIKLFRNKAVKNGQLIRREYPFFGTANFREVGDMTPRQAKEQKLIEDYWDSRIENSSNRNYRRNMAGQKTLELSRWLEYTKLPSVLAAIERDLSEGKRVVVFAEGINETEIKGLQGQKIPGFLSALAAELDKRGIKYAKVFEDSAKDKAKAARAFQNDDVKALLATPRSGGAGLDMDDVIGDRPRSAHFVTMNFSGDVFDQMMGRVSRRNTASPAEVSIWRQRLGFSDRRRQEILDRKLATLRNIQAGEDLDTSLFTKGEETSKPDTLQEPSYGGSYVDQDDTSAAPQAPQQLTPRPAPPEIEADWEQALGRPLPKRASGQIDWRQLSNQEIDRIFNAESYQNELSMAAQRERNESGIQYPPHHLFEKLVAKQDRLAYLERLLERSPEQAHEMIDLSKGITAIKEQQKVQSQKYSAIDEFLNNLKIDTGGPGAQLEGITGLPVLVWNGAIEVVRAAYKAGKSMAEAAKAGLDWIKANHPTLQFDEGQFMDKMGTDINERVQHMSMGRVNWVRGADEILNEASRADSITFAENFFRTHDIPVQLETWNDPRRGGMGINYWKIVPSGGSLDIAGTKAAEALRREIAMRDSPTQHPEQLASLIQSIRINFDLGLMDEFSRSVREDLWRLASADARNRGAALGALAGHSIDLSNVARNVDVYLDRVYAEAFGGDAIDGFLGRVRRELQDQFGGEQAWEEIQKHPEVEAFIHRVTEANRFNEGGRVYRWVQSLLKPKNAKTLGTLMSDAKVEEAVREILQQAKAQGIEPKPSKTQPLTALQKLLQMVSPENAAKIDKLISQAIIDAQRNAGFKVLEGKVSAEELQALRESGQMPPQQAIDEGMALPEFQHWQTIKDFLLDYDPVTLKLAQDVIKGSFKGVRFGEQKPGEPNIKIDLYRLAREPDVEVKRVLDAYLSDVTSRVELSGATDETRQRIRAMIEREVAGQLEARRREFRDPQFAPSKTPAERLTPEQRLGQLINAQLFADPRLNIQEMVARVASKSAVQNLTPKLGDLIKQVFDTPFYRQDELKGRFADMLATRLGVEQGQLDNAWKVFEQAFSAKFGEAKKKAFEKVRKQLTPVERDEIGAASKRGTWPMLEKMANAGMFDTGEALRKIAEQRGWKPPTDEEIAKLRELAEKEQRLRELTPKQVLEVKKFGGGEETLAAEQREQEASTRDTRAKLKKEMVTRWARITRPIQFWTPSMAWEQRRNNAMAANELAAANLLLTPGFAPRQFLSIFTGWMIHLPTRATSNAIREVMNQRSAGQPVNWNNFWNNLQVNWRNAFKAQSQAIRPALLNARAAFLGRTEAKNVDRLMSGIAALDRVELKAHELAEQGKPAQAFAYTLLSHLKWGFRVAQAMDYLHGTPASFQEVLNRVDQALVEQGKNPAERKVAADMVLGDVNRTWAEAVETVRRHLDAQGIGFNERELQEKAAAMVEHQMYERVRSLGLPADEFQTQNDLLRNTIGWNERETRGPGGAAAVAGKMIQGMFSEAGIPSLGIGAFSNAIGIGINRFLHFTPLYAVTNFKIPGVKEETGIHSSPWFRTAEDIAQRRVEAAVGSAFGIMAVGLVMGGAVTVQLRPPRDKRERELWEAQGHKAGTVEFNVGDGSFVPVSLNNSPLTPLAPYFAGSGALMDLFNQRAKQQQRLNEQAAKLGIAPGQIKPIDIGDMLGVAGEAAYGTIMGGSRTAAGLLGSLTDYGTPNATKTTAGLVAPGIPGLPALQQVSRLAGVRLDTSMASFWDFLLPLPTSPARRVNMLGDPASTPNEIQRIIQTLTGGTYPGVVDPNEAQSREAYQSLFTTGFRPPSINPAKGYNFGGTFRPMSEEELGRFTELRGSLFKAKLAALGPGADKGAVQGAFQQANSEALQGVGATIPAQTGKSATQGARRATGTPSGAGKAIRTGRSRVGLGGLRVGRLGLGRRYGISRGLRLNA